MTKNVVMYLVLFLLLGGTTAGCWGCFGSDDESSQTEMTDEDDDGEDEDQGDDPAENLGDAMSQAQQALQQVLGGEGGSVKESVDFRKLKDLLPDEVAGLERTSAEGERTSVMGMHFSNTRGEYQEGDEWIEISISDLGTLTGIAQMGYTAWLQAEIDRESDRGYERTRKFSAAGNEYPSYEKFEGEGDTGDCEIQVWAAGRFIVEIKGRNVEMEQCEDARDEIPYRQLDRMKDVGTDAE